MTDRDAWIQARLTAAMNAKNGNIHSFPPELIDEIQRFLADKLKFPCKQSELDTISERLILLNRGKL
ncbi:hypothetical protein [Salinarimonas rosea]|uniref:hypothetical protein n=1 Tax=Salinarimonas rosea TaxID=552063 RepID=UPI0012EC3210|nr:hypothetical protein [Salinarimonas rosea]